MKPMRNAYSQTRKPPLSDTAGAGRSIRPRRVNLAWLAVLAVLVLAMLAKQPSVADAQDDSTRDLAPTLVPPTPVSFPGEQVIDALPSDSRLAGIRERGMLRAGVLYNEPPYGELNLRGDVVGYDASIVRAIAEAWSVDVEFVQVTRQNWLTKLQDGTVDIVAAARVHRRELDDAVGFSQTYRLGRQVLMTRIEDEFTTLLNVTNQAVGYVAGSPGEQALRDWQSRTSVPIQPQVYLTYDDGLRALFAGEIAGLVGREERLRQVAYTYLDNVSILDEPIELEPFAIALPRQDRPLRLAINEALQYLVVDDTMETLHKEYFPSNEFEFDALATWNSIPEEAPTLDGVDTQIRYPSVYALPQIQQRGSIRVAGVEAADQGSVADQRIAQVQRRLLEELSRRWGVRIEEVAGDPLQMVRDGQAELALNVTLDWSVADAVDFSQPYLLRGNRLMVPDNSDVDGFNEIRRNQWIATISGDEAARTLAKDLSDSERNGINFYTTTAADAAATILVDDNADVVFGDSIALLPSLEQNPEAVRLTDRWYSRRYQAFAMPPNDTEFGLLVDYTLQAMNRDGTLASILQPLTPPGESIPSFEVWPGSNPIAGFDVR